ncbi:MULTISPECIES: tRNA (5-methylaminomethyl-2-thiouridine)(34)-methyltransferase MnmD [unclassified Brevundimonas]|uniref:tRNA (5-methylaminomethyl-2-thiouridine)(34)-methyltransferase MnmD n=1 Tax=unclassified Brevundimonas TaxID=2622653 RepID=UPI00070174A2|nr:MULTISPECIES: tRNA (5-methylaminomethyl-2-thiouridine)(34)-methyltransferase MnmD [unclassified Brevundimonas]KQY90890.1 FAD-dependent cmnm(5)s(2)U34 oxidoreductase [Brevundimonas sp. Root1423]KRA28398.1 FAD-dependent cmnm(5)s(2)U34 oxidoreductase [Brevundimonas sp. Root608]
MADDRSPRLIWTEDGALRSGRFDDVYFSQQDGLAETRAVFLTGCGLPEAWSGRRRFTVAELGFGTGLNIAALLDLWRREGPPDGRLHVFSVEGFPLGREEAARALSAWPELAGASEALLAAWPAPTPGFHRLDLPGFNAVVDLAIGDVAWALEQWAGRADAWFLDGFAPSTNPGMWSDAVMDGIAARSAPGARAATFTVAGSVRRGLAGRGFAVAKRPGHGRKRERLEAWLPGAANEAAAGPSVAVVGAGIAGASMARAFAALGVRPVVYEADRPGAGASGFPAALVTPRLDAGDAGIAALFAQALDRARALYAAAPGAVLDRGVLQLEQQARDAGRFGKVAEQPVWPEGGMAVLDAAACSARLGEPVDGGLLMGEALALQPAPVLAQWLTQADRATAEVAGVEPHDGGWRLIAGDGEIIAEADIVVVAAGWGVAGLWPEAPLSPVRGQADWVEGVVAPPVAWGGYAVPTGEGLLFGATHDRGEVGKEIRRADSERNLAVLAARLPGLAARVEAAGPGQARAAVRATTPDRLPLAGPVSGRPGLFVLGGLGSRGFCAAPLLAEHVAALALGAPSPLPADLAARVDPARWRKTGSLAHLVDKAEG